MNKHMIFLPVLLTSAVSLHALSFYIEPPVEMVQDSKVQVAAKPDTTVQTDIKVAVNNVPSGKQAANVVTIPVEKGNKTVVVKKEISKESTTVVPANTAGNPVTPASTIPVTAAVPGTASTTTITTSTVTTDANQFKPNIQMASALIPSKNFNDIVREAKVIGGRVDPFLSMKPPEIEKLPEVPVIASKPAQTNNTNVTQPFFPDNSLENTGKKTPNGKGKVTNPPKDWVPSFDDKPVKTSKHKIIKETSSTKIASAKVSKDKTKPAKEDDNMIIFAPETKVEDGLILTGIITGSKPLALITVDKESKVYSVGDIIRKNNNTKIVSIDFDTQAITITDNKNRKAKLELKD